MSGFTDIQAALMTAWLGAGITYPTAYEGRDFTPPGNAPWCALHVMPASTEPAALGENAPLDHVGLLQIDINHPLNSGTGPMLADADAIASAFDPGTDFTYNSQRIMIERCERSQIVRDDAWQTLYMTVKWRGLQHRV